MAQKKNIMNVFTVLYDLKNDSINSHHVSHEMGREGKLSLQDPLCVRSTGVLGASSLLFTAPPSEPEPRPGPWGSPSSYSPSLHPELQVSSPSLLITFGHTGFSQQRTNHFLHISAFLLRPSTGVVGTRDNLPRELSRPVCQALCDVLCIHDFISSTISAIIISIFRCGMEACRA